MAPRPDAVHVRAPGKINLYLGVGPRHDDGYHSLATVFQAVSMHDELVAQLEEPGHFSLAMSGEGASTVAVDDSNLAMRAARLVADRFGGDDRHGVRMTIK